MQITPGPEPRPAGALALIASRRFGPLFWTQFLSAFNDNALKNALVLMVAYRAGAAADAGGALSSELLIPLAGGLFILPFFLCSATAGDLADRSDKAWLIRWIKLFEIAVMVAGAAGILAGSAATLLFLLLVMGVEAAFFGPLKYAILPDLLAPGELVLGNALVEAGTYLAILLGTIAGMIVVLSHGAPAVAALIIAVALAAWAASRRIPATVPAAAAQPVAWNFLAATRRIIREAAVQRVPWRAMLGISWFWLVGATYLSQFPSYVHFVLGAPAAVVTLFLSVFSIGIALGSLLCSRLLRGRAGAGTVAWGALGLGLFSIDLWLASPVPGSEAAASASVAGFLAAPAHWRILGDLFAIAVAGGVFIVPLYVVLQTATAAAERARAIAANNVVNAAAMVLSVLVVMALLAAGLTIAQLFLICGVGSLAIAAWFRRLAPRLAGAAQGAASPKLSASSE